MLYLNTIWTPFWHYNLSNLTLTNVVFEYKLEIFFWSWKRYLTLTNVVFELQRLSEQYTPDYYLTLTNVVFESDNINNFQRIAIFNFNKCCIWIGKPVKEDCASLGFNFNKCCIWIWFRCILLAKPNTFNFNKCCIWIMNISNL